MIKPEHIIQKKKFSKYILEEKIKGDDIFFTDEKIFLLDFMPNKQTNQVRFINRTKKGIKGGKLDDKILSIKI